MSRLATVSMLWGLCLLGMAPAGAVAFAASERTSFGPDSARRIVAVIKDPQADRTCQEIVTRIVAELMADGIPVMVLTCMTGDAQCMSVSGIRPSAIVLVERRDDVRAVEVRAGDGLVSGTAGSLVPAADGGGHVQRLAEGGAGGGPAVLAIRSVEILKAMLIELADALPTPVTDAPHFQKSDVEPVSAVTQSFSPTTVVSIGPRNITLNLGAAVIGGFNGLNSAFGPSIRVGRRSSDHVLLSAVLDGPAYGREQRNPFGAAAIRHELVLLQADLLGLFGGWLVLHAGIGGGIYHIHVDGQTVASDATGASPTFVHGSGGGFAGLLSWSAGLVANLRPDVGIFLDGRLFVLTPTPAILLDGVELGRAGNPGVALSAGLELRL